QVTSSASRGSVCACGPHSRRSAPFAPPNHPPNLRRSHARAASYHNRYAHLKHRLNDGIGGAPDLERRALTTADRRTGPDQRLVVRAKFKRYFSCESLAPSTGGASLTVPAHARA